MLFRRPSPRESVPIKRTGDAFELRGVPDGLNEVVRSRIRLSELSNDGGQYFVRKVLVGSRSDRTIEVVLRLDTRYRPVSAEVTGGRLIPPAEWEESA